MMKVPSVIDKSMSRSRAFTESTMLWLNARSSDALGATIATLSGPASTALGAAVVGAAGVGAAVVGADDSASDPHPMATIPTALNSAIIRIHFFIGYSSPFSGCPTSAGSLPLLRASHSLKDQRRDDQGHRRRKDHDGHRVD